MLSLSLICARTHRAPRPSRPRGARAWRPSSLARRPGGCLVGRRGTERAELVSLRLPPFFFQGGGGGGVGAAFLPRRRALNARASYKCWFNGEATRVRIHDPSRARAFGVGRACEAGTCGVRTRSTELTVEQGPRPPSPWLPCVHANEKHDAFTHLQEDGRANRSDWAKDVTGERLTPLPLLAPRPFCSACRPWRRRKRAEGAPGFRAGRTTSAPKTPRPPRPDHQPNKHTTLTLHSPPSTPPASLCGLASTQQPRQRTPNFRKKAADKNALPVPRVIAPGCGRAGRPPRVGAAHGPAARQPQGGH